VACPGFVIELVWSLHQRDQAAERVLARSNRLDSVSRLHVTLLKHLPDLEGALMAGR
jgi:hypothetical protein